MRSGALPLGGWGSAVLAIALMSAVVFGLGTLPMLLLVAAGTAGIAVAAVAFVAERRHPRSAHHTAPALLLESSVATTALATGVVVTVAGAVAIGETVTGFGVGLTALGVGGVVRERRAGRRLLAGAHAAGEAP